jgi:NADH-quinone oxidoreductase subunit M
MDFLNQYLLTILIFLPMLGAILVLFGRSRDAVRWTAIGTTLLTFLLSLLLLATFDWHKGGNAYGSSVQMITAVPWIPAFNIQYRVGIDGLSLPLVLLSTFICVLAAIASWNIEKMTKWYMALFLFLETGILGVFLALDFFLFYVFFELSLLPMYFLIGIWGGPRKEYAAIKFFLYTLVGSIGLLIVLIGMYLYTRDPITGKGTFDLIALAGPAMQAKFGAIPGFLTHIAPIFFVLAMLGFLIKVPAVPFHTWLFKP